MDSRDEKPWNHYKINLDTIVTVKVIKLIHDCSIKYLCSDEEYCLTVADSHGKMRYDILALITDPR